MTTTSKMISYAENRQAQGFTRPQLIDLLDETVKLLYKYECPQTLIIDPATGRPPILATTNTVLSYNGPANSWLVSDVLFRWSRNLSTYDYGIGGWGVNDIGYNDAPPLNTTEPININGNFYLPYPFVKCDPALEGGLPVINFSRPPGDTTAAYYMQAYKLPATISSDQIQIPIPDVNGAHMKYVFPAFMKMVEAQNQGNYAEAIEYIEYRVAPKVWEVLSKGAQGKRHRVTTRSY